MSKCLAIVIADIGQVFVGSREVDKDLAQCRPALSLYLCEEFQLEPDQVAEILIVENGDETPEISGIL